MFSPSFDFSDENSNTQRTIDFNTIMSEDSPMRDIDDDDHLTMDVESMEVSVTQNKNMETC
jgi:hypothetical protein